MKPPTLWFLIFLVAIIIALTILPIDPETHPFP